MLCSIGHECLLDRHLLFDCCTFVGLWLSTAGKREKSGAALSSIYSQESMETGSSSDLIGMARSNSGSSSPSMVSSTGPAAPGAIARKLSGGSADAAEQPGSAVNGPSSSSSGKPPLAPTTQGSGEGSSSSTSRLAAASSPGDDSSDGAGGTTAAAAAAARSASGGAPNTGQATAISLHWLSKPRTVLVMRKLAPSTEAAFLQALEWLRYVLLRVPTFKALLHLWVSMPSKA